MQTHNRFGLADAAVVAVFFRRRASSGTFVGNVSADTTSRGVQAAVVECLSDIRAAAADAFAVVCFGRSRPTQA